MAAKIGPATLILAADQFFRYGPLGYKQVITQEHLYDYMISLLLTLILSDIILILGYNYN